MKKKILLAVSLCLAVTFAAWALIPPTQVVGSTTFVQSRIIRTSPCKLYTVLGYNSGPAQFVMVFASGSTPTNGQTGVFCFPVAATNYFSLDFGYYGADLDAASVCNSTTATTNTLGSVNCSFQGIFAAP